jgi:hypothetical protein
MTEKAAIVAVLIVHRPLCAECLAGRADVARTDVESLLTRIGKTIAISRTVDRCRGCGRTDRVYSAQRVE